MDDIDILTLVLKIKILRASEQRGGDFPLSLVRAPDNTEQ